MHGLWMRLVPAIRDQWSNTADLKAKYLLNLDSEDEGHFLAGCAGGVKATSVLPMSCASAEGTAMTLHV